MSNTAKRLLIGFPLAIFFLYITSLKTTLPVALFTYLGLLLSWWEFLPLVLPERVPQLFRFGGAAVASILFFVGIYANSYFAVSASIATGLMFMFNLRDYVAAVRNPSTNTEALNRLVPLLAAPMGLLYVLTLVMFLPKIHLLPHGNVLLGLYFCGVWATDTAAYFAGKAFGRRLLSPEISPKKTWEGLVGGVSFCVCWILIFKFSFAKDFLLWIDVVVMTVLLGPVSQLGDLAESLLKRSVDKKDAGNLLPGHGGILDRIDGFLLSAPLFYLYVDLRFASGAMP